MIETEIRTINEFGSRRLTIKFTDAGEPTNVPTILMTPQVYSLRKDDRGNVTSLTIDIPKEDSGSNYWPVEQTLREITESWNYKISPEDIVAIREQFPYPWQPTWNAAVDTPLPAGIPCDDCPHEATVCFRTWPTDIHDSLSYDKRLCKHCALVRRKNYAEEQIATYTDVLLKIDSALATAECGSVPL